MERWGPAADPTARWRCVVSADSLHCKQKAVKFLADHNERNYPCCEKHGPAPLGCDELLPRKEAANHRLQHRNTVCNKTNVLD